MTFLTPFSIRWLAMATLAVVAMAVVSAGPARAACGDYVKIGGQPADQQSMASHLPANSGPVAPCHGPGCSRHLPPPLVPPAAPPTVSAGEWICLFKFQADLSADHVARLTENERLCPIPRIDSIFHPPRVANG
jgi:hypothetical protein